MSDLAILNTAYPDANPWFDLRPYLANGWTAVNSQSCGMAAEPNLLIWSMRLRGDSSSSWIFMDGIPGNLRPPVNVPIAIVTPAGSSFALIYRNNGSLAVDADGREPLGAWDRSGVLTVFGVTPRGTPV
ncbi:hypothetical protein [Glutamicibacter ardleyensis]|uniref:hypothetical protein n=1 Tax=Glutamicibacter ardleyensis TaxID=225894 RepID=UPI003FCF7693